MVRRMFMASLCYVFSSLLNKAEGYYSPDIDYYMRRRGLERWYEPLTFEEDENEED